MREYLMRAEGVLGDKHSFVRLVDTMPEVRFCDHCPPEPEGRDEVEPWEEMMHCFRAGIVESDQGLYCAEHVPKPAEGFKHYEIPITASGDQRIVDAARVSIAGQDVRPTSDDRKLIRYLVKNRHTTPLEQVRFTFHCRIPIFVARQWIRHRTGSFNEESARYGKLAADFYIPTLERMMFGGQAKRNKQGSGEPLSESVSLDMITLIENHSIDSYHHYEKLLNNGCARELARAVLPVNIYTQWFWTTDLHNLMHFLTLRCHEHAQWESRQYAEAIVGMAEAVAPYAMEAWRDFRAPEGRTPRTGDEYRGSTYRG